VSTLFIGAAEKKDFFMINKKRNKPQFLRFALLAAPAPAAAQPVPNRHRLINRRFISQFYDDLFYVLFLLYKNRTRQNDIRILFFFRKKDLGNRQLRIA
jgi:hypothetical protein